ncbi:cation:dicarboxylate symporter family transporter [Echinimonas agarilytica]|uniref:Cation:dicarboxylase symporter family transporter n=1 Tax=Echinimonas agarilytica TaxID=1215918 RepID=A0AA42B655_9GAMM|nr:cation:dicarboxylase symporter family transporter [Echinimonas agarilytica]MCM2678397.1 cation:dicarboxylase symporter family transporter [Echinimonas agarilytica]
MDKVAKRWSRITSSQLILVGLILGLVVGLFFGEKVGWMEIIGEAVIMLMQMTIIPYILVSLIAGFGSLTKEHAKLLATKAGLVLLMIWAVALVTIFLTSLAFPSVEKASFFSTSVISPPPPPNLLPIYIPANPFKSLAEGSIPAVVVFAIALGVAFIRTENKMDVIAICRTTGKGLNRVTSYTLKTMPVGIFAITASAAGTMTIDELNNLQVFLLSFIGVGLLLTYIVLPNLIARLTPFHWREVEQMSRDALVTAFVTANVLIVLPVLEQGCKRLFKEREMDNPQTDQMVDVLIPIAFSFPNAGKLTVILFVLFTGWFVGSPIPLAEMPQLGITGMLSLFGAVNVAVPFLLDLSHLPADMYQLFLVGTVITSRLMSIAAVMHLVAFVLLSVCLIQGQWKPFNRSMLKFVAIAGIGLAMLVVPLRLFSGWLVNNGSETNPLVAMKSVGKVPEQVYAKLPEIYRGGKYSLTDVAQIKKRGVLRIGYQPGKVPFSYFNRSGDLVGLDISLSKRLADDLGVEVEFVPYEVANLNTLLAQGYFDIAISGLEMDADSIQKMRFTPPVLTLNLALVVLDHDRHAFKALTQKAREGNLVIAVSQHERLVREVREKHPKVEIVELDHERDFFSGKVQADALLISAEEGYAWTLFYPTFNVVIPKSKATPYPVGYAVAWQNDALHDYLDSWVEIQKVRGVLDQEYRFWILGEGAENTEPRWSIWRNVLKLDEDQRRDESNNDALSELHEQPTH